jgi:RNA polymerase sigma factor (sigma-70 family)
LTGAASAAPEGVSVAAEGSADGWVLATLPRALAFATGLLADPDAAEDVVHDCYCRLLQKADVYDLRNDGAKLLFRSITNACIDRSRRRSAISLSASEGMTDNDGEAGRTMDVADPRAAEPWQQIEHADLQRAVSAGLAKLPVAQRAALELKALGHSLQEIAEAVGVTATNAGVLVHRGRAALARHIQEFID